MGSRAAESGDGEGDFVEGFVDGVLGGWWRVFVRREGVWKGVVDGVGMVL